MKTSLDGLEARLGETPSNIGAELTVFVPPKANSKNMNVPENSLITATRSAPYQHLRIILGLHFFTIFAETWGRWDFQTYYKYVSQRSRVNDGHIK